ncbi:MAG: hypothetical protein JNM76_18085, partial [Betaproteobacteria bacterium]|nr:hypothetical protein [Betaproteobacteria bacterium]
MATAGWHRQASAQAAACSASETLQTFSFPSWTAGTTGPTAFTAGAGTTLTTLTFQSTASVAFAGAYPTLDTQGNLANSLMHQHNTGTAGQLLSTFALTFDRPVNKLRWISVDVDTGGAGGFQDETVSRVNGATVPTALTSGTAGFHTITLATGTATAVRPNACNNTQTGCNVTNDFNLNNITSASMQFRAGSTHVTSNQFIGWNNFSYCLPPSTTLTKAYSASPITPSSTSTLTFTITNGTGNPAQGGLRFTDTFQAGLTVTAVGAVTGAGCSGTTGFTASTVTLTNGAMTAGTASCTFTATIQGNTPGTYVNDSTRFSNQRGGINTAATTATLQVFQPALTATKSFGTNPVAVNTNSLLTLTFTNPNATAVTGLAFTDTFPVGLRVQGGIASNSCGGTPTATANGVDPGIITLTGGTIPASASCTITANVRGPAAGAFTNTISAGGITSTNTFPNVNPVSDTLVIGRARLDKSFSGALTVGGTVTLTFSINNTSVQAVSFTDTLPAGLVVGSGAVGGTCTGGSVTATAGTNTITVAGRNSINGTCTITVPITTAASPTTGTCPVAANTNGNANIGATTNITASVSNTAAGGGTSATGACVTVNAATPALTKAFSPTSIAVGGTSTLTFTVTQPTGNPTQTFSFTDTLPAGLVIATPNGLGGTCSIGAGSRTATAGTNTITITNNQITNPATSCTLTVNVTTANTPTVGVCPQANNTNGAANISGTTNLTNSVTSQCVGVTAAVPTVDKAFSGALTVGGTATLTFTVAQPTGNPTQTFSFTDTLPAGLVVGSGAVGGTCSGGAVTATAGTNTITVASRQIVNPATTCTITVPITTAASPTTGTCPVAANTNGNANIGATTNITASVSNTAAGGGTSATGACVTVNAATPTLNKAFSGALTVGSAATLTFTISMPAGNPTQTFSFTDTLPAGLVVANLPTSNLCTGAFTVTAGSSTINFNNLQLVSPATSCSISVQVTTSSTPTVGTCPQADNTNGNANISNITNITASVTNSAAGGGTSTTGACVTVNAATPALTKAFSPTSIGSGETSTLTFTVTQPTGNPTQTFSFTDTLPAGLEVGSGAVGGTCSGGSVTATAGTSTITITNRQIVNPATSCTITVPVTLSGTPVSTVCPVAGNTNGAASITGITNLTNNVTDQCLTVVLPTLTKAWGASTIDDSVASALVFTLTNGAGNPAQSGLGWTETLPANIRFTAASLPVA